MLIIASTTTSITRETTVPYSTTPNKNMTTTIFTPPVEFVCPSENGLYPNPDDCKTFYQCTGGKPYLKVRFSTENLSLDPEKCFYIFHNDLFQLFYLYTDLPERLVLQPGNISL